MNLVTSRDPFLQQLQFATSVCPARSTRPILTNVLLAVSGNTLEITATDGEISVRQRVSGEDIVGEGRAALPATTLLSAVRSILTEKVELSAKGDVHELRGGAAQFRLNGDDPELFPLIPSLQRERGADVPLGRFVDLCSRTMFAAAKEMGRYAFNGVLLELDPQEVTLVATDGRRLSLARMDVSTGVSTRLSVVVPLKALVQLQRSGGAPDTTLRIEVRDTSVAFLLPETEILAQIVEGEFPDFRAVLPKADDIPRQVDLDRQELARAIQRAAITAGDEGPTVELSFGKGSLKIVSRHEGLGESRSDLAVDYDGDGVEIRFNPGFIGEYLKTMPEEQVTFRFKDRASAGMFSTSPDSLYVVMPITS